MSSSSEYSSRSAGTQVCPNITFSGAANIHYGVFQYELSH